MADIKPFIDPVFDNNVLLTQTERLMMSNRPKDPKNARNKNILVIGGSGSGKTRFFCKPNIMQLHSSYVITDPKGSLICEVGQLLQRAKYRIAVLNTINFSKSMHYNPFAYLRTEKDILKLVNTIIINTKGEGAQSTEDFWVKAERLYYTALIGYIHYEAPEEEKNFITLGAQGLYNISTPVSNPQPGDLVFFVGTYDTPGVSHVGIYVGNSMMIHCGDPISYSNLNSSYWQAHFYAYARPPYN